MYTYMYVHVYIRICVHIYTYTYIYAQTYIDTYTCIYKYTYIHKYLHTYIYTCTFMYILTHICICVIIHICIYKHRYALAMMVCPAGSTAGGGCTGTDPLISRGPDTCMYVHEYIYMSSQELKNSTLVGLKSSIPYILVWGGYD